jgi:hypothetical protein
VEEKMKKLERFANRALLVLAPAIVPQIARFLFPDEYKWAVIAGWFAGIISTLAFIWWYRTVIAGEEK